MALEANERVLLVGRVSAAEIRKVAGALTEGSLCVLTDVSAVADLRRELRDVTNVLIVPEDEDGTVPWADGYFTRVIAPEITPELRRVSQQS